MSTHDVDASWEKSVSLAYMSLGEEYRHFLEQDSGYFPSKENYFNAFKTLPKHKVKYILFGQDPYPREQSASGYAFIDHNVTQLFSPIGLSKEVNRATSLRNFIKMALVASGKLSAYDTSQEAIAQLDKTSMIDTIQALRLNFENNGVLLLNTALIFTDKQSSTRHIRQWRPFMQVLLDSLASERPTLIFFGTHASALLKYFSLESFETITLPHPYNHTFVTDKKALSLFSAMKLLER